MCVDQMVSQVGPIHRSRPGGIVRLAHGNVSHGRCAVVSHYKFDMLITSTPAHLVAPILHVGLSRNRFSTKETKCNAGVDGMGPS
jgi:hypothetical protein